MRARSEEPVECPVCGAELWERRPPFRLGPNRFSCEACGAMLRFSKKSQKRLVYVVFAVLAFGPSAFLAHMIFGDLAGIFAALGGALIVLGMLVWQGRVAQLEEDR